MSARGGQRLRILFPAREIVDWMVQLPIDGEMSLA